VLREIVPATRRADANHPGRNATRLSFRGITPQKDERVRREPGPTPRVKQRGLWRKLTALHRGGVTEVRSGRLWPGAGEVFDLSWRVRIRPASGRRGDGAELPPIDGSTEAPGSSRGPSVQTPASLTQIDGPIGQRRNVMDRDPRFRGSAFDAISSARSNACRPAAGRCSEPDSLT
jgi:hypothetical protein